VADQGAGVLPELRHRLREPFFSTKEGGAGLGLAISSRLISDAGGDLAYRPNQPKGSVFTVELPSLRKRQP
jgi:C4-dicarboxylate-specific signal transduction histidine kinase